MFCPSCRGEFREGFTRCRDCEVDLVEALPDEESREVPDGTREAEYGAEEAEEEPEEERATEADRVKSLRALELLLVLGVSFGYTALTAVLDWWHEPPPLPSRPDSTTDLILLFVAPLQSIALLYYVLFRQGRSLRQLGLTAQRSDLPLAFVVLVLSYLPYLIARAVLQDESYAAEALDPVAALRGIGEFSPLLVASVLLSAAWEELIVRAYLITEVSELTGNVFLAIAASVCFQGLYHLYQGSLAALLAAGTFLVSSIFYVIYRRITPVILAHFFYNLLLGGYWDTR